MRIQELSQRTAVPAKTIRYYGSIGLMPDPQRGPNNYRQYTPESRRTPAFYRQCSQPGVQPGRHRGIPDGPGCGHPAMQTRLDSFDERILEIDRRIADLLALRDTLSHVRQAGADLPADKKCDEECLCSFVSTGLAGSNPYS